MVSIKAKINEASLKKALAHYQALINHNIEYVVLNEAVPELIDRIMVGFDSLADRAEMLPEDPTNPANWREEFRLKLNEDVYDTISVNQGVINFQLGEKSYLGYDPSGQRNNPNDSSPLQWMVYYIEGLAGDWGFITPEIYEMHRGQDSFSETWGRFGKGFMISREAFESEGWGQVTTFDQIRHPFSGYAPVDIFTEALREFQLKPFVERALKAAASGIKL